MSVTLRQIVERTSVKVFPNGVKGFICKIGEGFAGDTMTGNAIEVLTGREIGSSKSFKDFCETVYRYLNK